MAKKTNDVLYAERQLLSNARRYARMKLFGFNLDAQGNLVYVANDAKEQYIECYRNKLEGSAIRLIEMLSLDDSDREGV